MAGSRGDSNFLKARQEAKKGELDEQLKEYINEWRKQRAKEEEELKRLKEKQAKRKEIRYEPDPRVYVINNITIVILISSDQS